MQMSSMSMSWNPPYIAGLSLQMSPDKVQLLVSLWYLEWILQDYAPIGNTVAIEEIDSVLDVNSRGLKICHKYSLTCPIMQDHSWYMHGLVEQILELW